MYSSLWKTSQNRMIPCDYSYYSWAPRMSQRVCVWVPWRLLLQNTGLASCSVPRLTAFIFAAQKCRDSPGAAVWGLRLHAFARLFPAKVRQMIAETENSFFSLVFIYTLIKEPFALGEMVARGTAKRAGGPAWGQTRDVPWTKTREAWAPVLPGHSQVVTTLGKVSGWWLCSAVVPSRWLASAPPAAPHNPTFCLTTLFVNVQKNNMKRVLYFGQSKPRERSGCPHQPLPEVQVSRTQRACTTTGG